MTALNAEAGLLERLLDNPGDVDGAPEWVRVAQDGVGAQGGFWTCAAATRLSALSAELETERRLYWEEHDRHIENVGTLTRHINEATARAEAAEAEVSRLREAVEATA